MQGLLRTIMTPGRLESQFMLAANIATSNIKAKLHLDDLVDLIIRVRPHEVLYMELYKHA